MKKLFRKARLDYQIIKNMLDAAVEHARLYAFEAVVAKKEYESQIAGEKCIIK